MLKRFCVVSLASLALGTFTGVPAQAGYTLNPEVKDATPALKQAAEIGVRKHETPELAKEKNKDAILVLSFGTTYKDSRAKTIEKTVSDIQAAHPDVKTVLAFTSHIIVDRIAEKEGKTIPTPKKARLPIFRLKRLRQRNGDCVGFWRGVFVKFPLVSKVSYINNISIFLYHIIAIFCFCDDKHFLAQGVNW